MTKAILNIEAILECARRAGMRAAGLEKLQAELQSLCEKGQEWNLPLSQVAKALSEIDQNSAPFLPRATELQGRLILGQWRIVAEELEWLADQCEASPSPRYESLADVFTRSQALRHFARIFKATPEDTGAACSSTAHNLSYAAHQSAHIVACPKADCGTRDCWASRRWCQTLAEEQAERELWRKEREIERLAGKSVESKTPIESARELLEHAVATEQYEFAAKMRDILAALERVESQESRD
mgnify:FL=1